MQTRLAVLSLSLLALTAPTQALTLDDVRRTLGGFRGESPMRVRIDSVERRVDGKDKSESSGASTVEDDGASIRVVHDKKDLRRQSDRKSRANHQVSASDAMALMNYAPELMKLLEGATLGKVTASNLDGVPAQLLEITPLREKDEDGDRWVKNYVDTLHLWLGPGGVPIGAKRTLKVKARIVVIGIEFEKKEQYRFAPNADRLVVTRRILESNGSGLGQHEDEWGSATVTVLR